MAVTRAHAQGEQSEDHFRYMAHRAEMRSRGHDPDFIGVTEVRQVCCEGCGKAIPWRVLRGWQD